jgi:beta-glucosidase
VVETPADAAAMAVESGTDLNCGNTYPALIEAVKNGLIGEDKIDIAVKRLFKARFDLGMFDDPDKVKWAQIPYDIVGSKAHQKLALQASRESLVLLKNEGNTLPFSKDLNSIAVIGPNAVDYQVMLGNYHGTANDLKTPLEALKAKLPNKTIRFAEGCEIAGGVPSYEVINSNFLIPEDSEETSERGLSAQYFDNINFEGEPKISRTDKIIDFTWKDDTPISGQLGDEFSVRWTGYLVPEHDGHYKVGVNACNGAKFYFNDSLLIDFHNPHHPLQVTKDLEMEAGKKYKIRFELINDGSDPQAHLIWAAPKNGLLMEAVSAAKESDAVLLFLGLTPHLEGEEMPVKVKGFEGGDRSEIDLPDTQLELIEAIRATGKPIALVLLGGSAIAFPQVNRHIPAIVYAWYPGEFGGDAIADVLFGDYNPGGRLPVTLYNSISDLPDFENYDMDNRTYKYFDGTPLYPFGFGLSFTQFKYENLTSNTASMNKGGTTKLTVNVTNTGEIAGEEVVQLYISDNEASVKVPKRTLIGFQRIQLKAGETKIISFELNIKDLAIINNDGKSMVEPGTFTVSVGGGQPGTFEKLSTSGPVLTTVLSYDATETLFID